MITVIYKDDTKEDIDGVDEIDILPGSGGGWACHGKMVKNIIGELTYFEVMQRKLNFGIWRIVPNDSI